MDDFKNLVWTNQSGSTSSSAPKHDAFSLLASSQQRPSPNYLASNPPSRSLTPSNPSKLTTVSSSSDAFSGLLSMGGMSVKQTSNLTMAERQAQAERERREKAGIHQQTTKAQPAVWSGLDALGSSASGKSAAGNGSSSGPATLLPTTAKTGNNTTLGTATPVTLNSRPIPPTIRSNGRSPAPSTSKPNMTVWDFDLLGDTTTPAAQSTSAAPPPSQAGANLLDDFDLLSDKPVAASTEKQPARTSTPGDFDWGDREGGDGDEDEDDVLGLLAKPASSFQAASPDSTSDSRPKPSSPRPPQATSKATRSSSPPPHVLGKLVEMGFSIQQARVALAATETGADVEAAMEILLAQAAVDESDRTEERRDSPDEHVSVEEERRRRHQARRQGPSRADVRAAQTGTSDGPDARRRTHETDEDASTDTFDKLADHADKVIAQASEIGASLFNKANSFWKSANKAYEDRSRQRNAPSPVPGRPKWMAEPGEEDRAPRRQTSLRQEPQSEFRDGGDDARHPVLPPRPEGPRTGALLDNQGPSNLPRPNTRNGSLFAPAEEPTRSYVSPHRRKARPAAESAPSRPVDLPPPPPPPPLRTYVTCAPSTLSQSSTHRSAGTAAYKLGQFANAETEFTRAIDVLPEKHMALIPLWNNRAMSRIKTGDGPGAVSDCSAVLELVGPSWKLGDDAADAGGANGAGVDLGEALVKAVTRRAMAYEMNEKWDKAREDWEKLVGIGDTWGPVGVKARTEAFRGLERCKKMAASPSEAPVPKPPPAARRQPPRPAAVAVSFEATARLKAANKVAEAEEAERYRLKDSVDARLVAWKGGKETNVRALIASLENVLWPELGWTKVGMADLITEQQVKVRYMKAIAKLHPDKLRNATVEHQMIANGVFGALNEAYNVFKP